MARIPPPVAAVRLAVRRSLAAVPAGSLVLVACSGGADSTALAAATAFVAPRLGLTAGLVTVDHGLQPGSAERAAAVAAWARTAGLEPAEVATVDVGGLGGGPEAAARTARYAALTAAAERLAALVDDAAAGGLPDGSPDGSPVRIGKQSGGAAGVVRIGKQSGEPAGVVRIGKQSGEPAGVVRIGKQSGEPAGVVRIGKQSKASPEVVVLLGHTRDDQAETVLLALARGAGPRGLSGMPHRRGIFLRPLLDVSRADTRKACAAEGLVTWEDPHNTDPAYARSRVRAGALPALVAALGPAVVDNLARTATQLATDNAALDALAAVALAAARTATGLGVSALAGLEPAVRTRVLHCWARELGAPGGALTHRHVAALDALVTDWHGQGTVALPGGIGVARRAGDLLRVQL